jgi:hypothetical protein
MSYVNQNYFSGDHFPKDVSIGAVAGMIALMVLNPSAEEKKMLIEVSHELIVIINLMHLEYFSF